ncbi:BRO family protein [Cytobacillus horneckiae]|uniref:BRO family protein n=1 Tax=Cytobacillus horneckiae TaxID=549687 RepID=UPI0034CDFF1E
MTNELSNVEVLVPISEIVFNNQTFNIYGTFDNPLFLGKDISIWIGHNKPAEMIRNVDEDEKLMATISHSGQNRQMWFLTEQGMYEVLMQSRKPIAKECKKVIKTHLKEMRTTGVSLRQGLTLQQQSEILLSKLDEVLNQQEAELAFLTQQCEMLGKQAGLLIEEITLVDNQIKELQPYAKKYKEFLAEDALMTIDDFARIMHPRYNLGRNQLFQWMRNNRMLGSDGRQRNLPKRQLVNRNILKLLKGQVFITKQGFDYLCDALDTHFNL